MSVTGARSTRYPLSGLGCGCSNPLAGLGIDGAASRTGATVALAAGALGLAYLLSTSNLAMNATRRRAARVTRKPAKRRRRRTSEKNYAYVGYVLYARNVSRLADPFSRLTPAENKALMKRYATIGAAKRAMARLKKRHGRHLMFELKGLMRAR